jgi:hypothetical protein
MSLKRKEKKDNGHVEKAACFFVACQPNLNTRVTVTEAMRTKGYSDYNAANLTLQMQVHHTINKIKEEVSPHTKLAAVLLLLALATAVTAARLVLCTITPNQMAALIVLAGGVNAGILPPPDRKVLKTSHQSQISMQNEVKCKAVYAQAHARTTTLAAKERAKPNEVRRMSMQVIKLVKGEFRQHHCQWHAGGVLTLGLATLGPALLT